jgi:predicted small lipoprotein YifL
VTGENVSAAGRYRQAFQKGCERMQRPSWPKYGWPKHGWLIGGMLAVALTMSGCGVRGSLETSEEAKAAKAAESAQAKSAAASAKAGEPAPPKPHKPFVLDGLIR